jgi:hypothetical protein
MPKDYSLTNDVPVDATAARVMQKGEHFHGRTKSTICTERLEAPSAYLPLPLSSEDLRGKRIGNLLVLGFLGRNSGKRSVWQVRCVCGYYIRRTARALRDKSESELICNDCAYREKLRNGLRYDKDEVTA